MRQNSFTTIRFSLKFIERGFGTLGLSTIHWIILDLVFDKSMQNSTIIFTWTRILELEKIISLFAWVYD